MKNSSKNTSFLATSSKKFFKIGLACSLALTIAAFKLPFYYETPTCSLPPQIIEENGMMAISVLSTKPIEKKLELNKEVIKAPVINIIPDTELPSPVVENPIIAENADGLGLSIEHVIETTPVVPVGPIDFAEIMPEFNGGEAQLFSYLANKLHYSAQMIDLELEGKVYIRFVIDKEGKVTRAEVAKGVDKLLNDQALKVVQNMPDWTPGIQNGEKVSVVMVLPINFELR